MISEPLAIVIYLVGIVQGLIMGWHLSRWAHKQVGAAIHNCGDVGRKLEPPAASSITEGQPSPTDPSFRWPTK